MVGASHGDLIAVLPQINSSIAWAGWAVPGVGRRVSSRASGAGAQLPLRELRSRCWRAAMASARTASRLRWLSPATTVP